MDIRHEQDEKKWLRQNEGLRMDANDPYFPEERRSFHLQRYKFAKEYCHGKKVLDGACGTGYGVNLLSEAATEIVGIDISAEAIKYAKANYANENSTFLKSPVENTPFESGSFDIVTSFETVEHTLCPISHMMEIARVLNPQNGLAILSIPNNWGLTEHHFLDFNQNLLSEVLAPFFRDVEYFYQTPTPHQNTNKLIGPLNDINTPDAQCIIAICKSVRSESIEQNKMEHVFEEIYENAFKRHHDYLGLKYKVETSLWDRVINRLRVRGLRGLMP